MRKSRLAFAVLLVSLLAQVPAIAASLGNGAAINAWLDQSIRNTRVPGVVALVTDREGVIYTHVAGDRSRTSSVPMTADTLFNIASMTKPIGATAIMMLVEEGKLSLDDPISKYVPEFKGRQVIATFNDADASHTTRPAAREVTIRHLLSHSSGLAYGFASNRVSRLSAARPGTDAATFPLLYDPGSAWSYAGGIAVVGRVLERIEGKGLDVFMQERIFGPLGMTDTSYVVPAAKRERVAPPWRLTDAGLVESPLAADVRSPVSADGGLYSTAADYAKYIRLILNGGRTPDGRRLLSEESVRILGRNHLGSVKVSLQDEPAPQLARAFPLGAGRDGFGLGFQVTGEPRQPGMRAPGSLSWAGIYNTEFWIDPATGIGAVLLMQYLPFYDADAITTLTGFEQRVYEGLRAR
jgi:CubicO group peptidase (beta-lactamase class C family)